MRKSGRSVQTRLLAALTLTVLGVGLLATVAAFWFAYSEAQEFQDDNLRQVALLGKLADRSALVGSEEDTDARIRVLPEAGRTLPVWVPKHLTEGFHTLTMADGDKGRVYVRHSRPGGQMVLIVQSTQSRNEAALENAWWTLVPWLLFLPVLLWLIVHIVRRELAAVRTLSHRIDQQSADCLEELPVEQVPDEILPLVEAVNRMMVRVNHVVLHQKRFIADASHELRTPLTALSLQVENVERAGSLPLMQQRVAMLKIGIERLRRLTTQLLDLARLQLQGLEPERILVSDLVREVIASVLPLAESRQIELELQLDADPVERIDVATFRLVVHNLLENAIKYNRQAGQVRVRIAMEGDDLVVDVADEGSGIPADQRESAFRPFFRLAGQETEGSGLGLAIVREAADRLGGTVVILDNSPASGITVRYRQSPDRESSG